MPPPGKVPRQRCSSLNARNFAVSPTHWTRHSAYVPNSELCRRPTLSCADVKTFHTLTCASTPAGVPPNCTRGAEWDLVREEFVDPPRSSFSSGIRIRFGPRYFQHVLKIWQSPQHPSSRSQRLQEGFNELERRYAGNYHPFQRESYRRSRIPGRTLPLAAG